MSMFSVSIQAYGKNMINRPKKIKKKYPNRKKGVPEILLPFVTVIELDEY